jgi:hypothetical protein
MNHQQGREDVSLESLPNDTLNAVFSFLFYHELQACSVASRRMNEAVSKTTHLYMSSSRDEHSFGRSLALETTLTEAHVTCCQLRNLLRRYDSLNVMHLHGLAGVGDDLFRILNESPTAGKLRDLSLNGCRLSYWCQTSLNLHSLRKFAITGGGIRVAFLNASFFQAFPDLESLTIGQCSTLQDENVADMARLSSLQALALHQCLRVKKPVLQLDSLTSLDLTGCFSLQDLPDFHCPSLRSLILSFCFQLSQETIQRILQNLEGSLERVALIKCPLVRRLELHSSTLQSLNVSLNNNLEQVILVCPNLQELETVSCTCLHSVHIMTHCMTRLNLTMLPLRDLQVTSHSLRELRLAGCHALQTDACRIQCPMLTGLDLCGTNPLLLSADAFGPNVKHVMVGPISLPLLPTL